MLLSPVISASPAESGPPDSTASSRVPARWVLRVSLPGRRFLLGVESDSPIPDGVDATVLVADLLRPGWRELARPLVRPVLRDDVLYRGFDLRRPSTLSRFGERSCHLRCLIPEALTTEFSWGRAARTLDALHETLTGPAPGSR